MNKKTTLTQVTWFLLRSLLQQPGWAVSPRDIVVAGRLDDTIESKLAPQPEVKDGKLDEAENKAWSEAPVEIELMSKDREVVKKCLNAHIEKKALGVGKSTRAMVEEFLPEES